MASPFQSALLRAKRRRHGRPAPVNPPPGTYDPTLDAQGRQSQRSYDDLLQDFARGKQRSEDDLSIGLGNLNTQRDQSLADLVTDRTRLGEDHTTALANLDRNYGTLAGRQAEGALRGNVQSAGLLAQALARRRENLATDQQPINTAFSRAMADSTTAEQRTKLAATNHGDALKLAFDRAYGKGGDNAVNLSRAGRDLIAGNLDLSGQKWWQAAQLGYSPIPKKKKRSVIV